MVWLDRLILFFLCFLIFVLPATIGGMEIFASLAVVLYLAKKIILFFRKKYTASVPLRVFTPAIAFVAVCAVSIFLSEDPSLSARAFVGKILQGVVLFFTVIDVVNTRKRLVWFLAIFLTSATILCLDGLWQLWRGKDVFCFHSLIEGRICASLRHPNDLGAYMILAVATAFSFALWRWSLAGEKTFIRLFQIRTGLVLWVALMCAILGLTYSRGAWLGAFVFIAIFIVLRRAYAWAGGAAILVFAVVFLPAMMFSRNVSFMSDNVAADSVVTASKTHVSEFTGQDRLNYWKDALRIIHDHPLTGTGLNTYATVIKRYSLYRQMYAHNTYLQMTAELGFVGLGVFLWFLWSVWSFVGSFIVRIRRANEDGLALVLTGLVAGWIGFLVESGLDTSFYSAQLSRLLWIVMGILVAGVTLLKKEAADPKNV